MEREPARAPAFLFGAGDDPVYLDLSLGSRGTVSKGLLRSPEATLLTDSVERPAVASAPCRYFNLESKPRALPESSCFISFCAWRN